jgi:cobalt-zinc-cadmium efflux system protein
VGCAGHLPHAHDRGRGPGARSRALGLAFAAMCGLLAVEAVGAWLSGSLALGADAGHVLGDTLALGLSAWAARLALRPPTDANTYGFGRAGVLVALGNGALLLLLASGIAVAAVGRLLRPAPVHAGLMLLPAGLGLALNLLLARYLHPHAHADLNARGAWLHVVGDAGSAAAVLLGALVIGATGWTWVDPLLSLGIAAVLAVGAWGLLRRSGQVLLEVVPEGLDPPDVAAAMAGVPGVLGVHHLHLWSIGGGRRALSGHLVLGAISLEEGQQIAREVERVLGQRFGIEHCTLQIEAVGDCPECDPR